MKNKSKIILSCIAVTVGVFLGVWYFINPDSFMYFMSYGWEKLNEPLPLVGFSIITIGGFVMAFLKTTSVGQKGLKRVQEKYDLSIKTKDETIDALSKAKEYYEQKSKELEEQYTALNEKFNKMIDILPNKKLKELKYEENNEREE